MCTKKSVNQKKAFNNFIIVLFFFIFVCLAVFTPRHVFAAVYCPDNSNPWTGLVDFPLGSVGYYDTACMDGCQYTNTYGLDNVCDETSCFTHMTSTSNKCNGTEDGQGGDSEEKPDVSQPPDLPEDLPQDLPIVVDCKLDDTYCRWVGDIADAVSSLSTSHDLKQTILYNAIEKNYLMNRDNITSVIRLESNILNAAETMERYSEKLNQLQDDVSDSLYYSKHETAHVSDLLNLENNISNEMSIIDSNVDFIKSELSTVAVNASNAVYLASRSEYNLTQKIDETNANIEAQSNSLHSFISDMQTDIDEIYTWSKAAKNNSATAKNRAIEARDSADANGVALASLTSDVASLTSDVAALADSVGTGDGTGGGDMSGVISAVGDGNNILDDIKDSVICDADCMASFAPEGRDFERRFLYDSDTLIGIQNSIDVLNNEALEQIQQFKTLFSFDTSLMIDGTYKDHSLSLFVNGQDRTFESGVFPALLDNSTFIAAVLFFLAVLLGLRSLGN